VYDTLSSRASARQATETYGPRFPWNTKIGANMNQDEILGIVRTLLSAIGGYAVAKGLLDQATMITIAGAAASIVVAIWSVISKRPKAP
jgi:hypothetical protein